MNEYEIARPEEFIRTLHPESTHGRLVLERKIKRTLKHSRVAPEDAGKIARLSYKVPDVSFSVASFYGMPLLTNFANTRCLYLQFRYSPDLKNRLYNLLDEKGFKYPTAFVTSGSMLYFFWFLEKPLTSAEFYKVYLFQHALYRMFHELKPVKDCLNVGSLVPLVGTIASENDGFVSLNAFDPDLVANKYAEQMLLRELGGIDYEDLKNHSQALLELHSLLNDRFMILKTMNAVEDWLLFFGASLCLFCTREQLVKELRAIAVSLEGEKWNCISDRYGALVNSIASTAIQGYIAFEGSHVGIDRPDWFELVAGKLDISSDEVRRLGLRVLAPSDTRELIAVIPDSKVIRPIGDMSFVPVERLFIKAVA